MCFTVNVNLIKEELENRYGATLIDPDKYRPSYYYHAFSLPELPVICLSDPSKLRMLRWGLIPSWTRSRADADEIRYKTFNARAESIETKPAYSSSVNSKRCIIPVQGFFEWQHAGKEKIPYYIRLSDEQVMSLAGLYADWTDSSSGETFSTFTVITTDANELMAEIHNSARRMPAILDRESEKLWVSPSLTAADALQLLKPYRADGLEAHTISPLITSRTADRNTPELIKPYTYFRDNLLF